LNSIGLYIKKNWRVITFIIVLIILVLIIWKLITVLLPFLVGLVLAFLLLPAVHWLQKYIPGFKKHPNARRIISIVVIYVVGLVVLAALVFYMATTIRDSIGLFWQSFPNIAKEFISQIQDLLAGIRLEIPASLLQDYDNAIASAEHGLVNVLKSGLMRGASLAWTSASLLLGFLSLPLIVFFMLKDWDKLRDGFFYALPTWASEHAKNVVNILESVLGRYIRGQIIMSVIVGVLVLGMTTALRVPFAPALAIWAALMENFPLIGVWLSIIAGVIVAFANDPSKVIWLILGYVIIQQIENILLVPRVQGKVMKMNPIFIILASLTGAYLLGLVGFIIAIPVTVTIIQLFKYFKNITEQTQQN
jgi:predicted PurR-regulated permease PerM